MTREDKELLFKDLCARIPYNVKCNWDYRILKGINISINDDGDWDYFADFKGSETIEIKYIKPYLRPISSMTEEEKAEYYFYCERKWDDMDERFYYYDTYQSIDWLLSHHFDFRGLIEKGIAIEAPEGMYKEE